MKSKWTHKNTFFYIMNLVLIRPHILNKTPLTSGSWSVTDRQIWVDEERDLVFFHALKDTPLEKHLYVTSLNQPGTIKRLTTPGYSHSVQINEVGRKVGFGFSE